ncbi:unnamed protein product, partial [Pylaiella littoralis]
ATLFVGEDEGLDKDATVEGFMIVAGLSSIAFGTFFNLPFIVAPSVLYAAREAGMTVSGHLAAQAIANLLAAAFFARGLKVSLATLIPTALRLGAGCGISMMVSVLGLRSLGLLAASDPFTLQPFTWQSIVGLAVITVACGEVSDPNSIVKKWLCAVGLPVVFTLLVYATTDRTKFEEFPSDKTPLSNWRDGSLGIVSFYEIWDAPRQHCFYIVRTFFSITINVSSILLVLVDAVCLEEMRTKIKSCGDSEVANAIGGTKKFRVMAYTIPVMSCFGNLLGVTTQAAFVQTMILVFVGGKTGLGAVVTGVLFILSAMFRPLFFVPTPGHISGALMVIISLRYLTVIRMIDVTRPSNLLMFGMSILLVPFSFDFVDALCIAAVLGFLCEAAGKLKVLPWSAWRGTRNKVAISAPEGGECKTHSGATLDYRHKDGEPKSSTGTRSTTVTHHENNNKKVLRQMATPFVRKDSCQNNGPARHGHEHAVLSTMQPLNPNKPSPVTPIPAWSSKHKHPLTAPEENVMDAAEAAPAAPSADSAAVHWALALVATLDLVLSA